MERGWYFLSYDISGSRHCSRVQRYLRKAAHPLLESLYLYYGNASEALALLTKLRQLAGPSAENVVMYRLRQQDSLWACGALGHGNGIMDFSLPLMRDPLRKD